MIEGQGIAELTRPDAQEPVFIFLKEAVEFLPQIFQVHKNRDPRLGKIILEDAVGAVQRTLEVEVDDEIATADIMGGAGAGLDEFAFLDREKEVLFPLLERIFRAENFSDGRLLLPFSPDHNPRNSA